MNCKLYQELTTKYLFFFYNKGTFHDQVLRTLHEDPNLGVLTTPQQSIPGKLRVSLAAGFKS